MNSNHLDGTEVRLWNGRIAEIESSEPVSAGVTCFSLVGDDREYSLDEDGTVYDLDTRLEVGQLRDVYDPYCQHHASEDFSFLIELSSLTAGGIRVYLKRPVPITTWANRWAVVDQVDVAGCGLEVSLSMIVDWLGETNTGGTIVPPLRELIRQREERTVT